MRVPVLAHSPVPWTRTDRDRPPVVQSESRNPGWGGEGGGGVEGNPVC